MSQNGAPESISGAGSDTSTHPCEFCWSIVFHIVYLPVTCSWLCCCWLFVCFETGSCYVALAGLEFSK